MQVDASVDHGFAPDVTLRDGDVVEGKDWALEAVFTPGHMSNHMSFSLAGEKALLAGDHVMAWATSVVAPPDGRHARLHNTSIAKPRIFSDTPQRPSGGP